MMHTFSIRDLEHLSGIKAHTIRMWEQRYGILKPSRTSGNIRTYDDEDLRMLLNIAVLNRQGMRISKIAGLSPEELQGSVRQATLEDGVSEGQVDALVISMIDLDEEHFDKILASATLRDGFEDAVRRVLYPFLDRIGVLWMTGSISPAHEHFIANLIRQKLIVAIDGLYVKPSEVRQTWMLFLPEGEHHEIGLLFLHYLLKKRGHAVVYLGANVPLDDVLSVGKVRDVDGVYAICTTQPGAADAERFLMRLADAFIGKPVVVSGARFREYRGRIPTGVRILEDQDSVMGFVEAL